MSNKFERLSKIAQDEFGVSIKSKSPTGETFESLYGKITDNDKIQKEINELIEKLVKTNSYGTLNAVAESLYNDGYRKQNYVTKEIFDEIDRFFKRYDTDENYSFDNLMNDISELKKYRIIDNS